MEPIPFFLMVLFFLQAFLSYWFYRMASEMYDAQMAIMSLEDRIKYLEKKLLL